MGKNPKVLNVVNKEAADLENIPIEEVFKNLRCNREGLTSTDAQERLAIFGHNKLEEKESKFLNFLGYLRNPLSLVMGGAAVMGISLANGGGRPPDWQTSGGIISLLLINSTCSYIMEKYNRNVAATRFAEIVLKARVLRDENWSEEDDSVLVPGDIISIKIGDTVLADARLLEGDPLKIYQFALTGESLPITKGPGDCVYTGSICQQGETEAVVIATGVHTSLRKSDHIADRSKQVQRVLEATGNFCIRFVAVVFIIDIIVMYCIQHRKYRPGIDNILVLLIGGIPVSMPAIHSNIMQIGASYLARVGAIANRMTAIVDMARMDVFCTDKTGILTLNMLRVQDNLIEVFAEDVDKDTVFLMAARASSRINCGTMDAPYFRDLNNPQEARAGLHEVDFVPYSSTDKRTTLTYLDSEEKMHRVSKGAPEDILNLAHNKSDIEHRVHAVIDMFAEKGMHSVAVAYQEVPDGKKESSGGPWQFIGVLPLLDLPRHDSATTIRVLSNLGVNVKMITGDQLAFGKETGRRLGMGTNMYPSSALLGQNRDSSTAKLIEKADGFASVLPEHRYEILKHLQSRKHICGMTGIGVDDIPSLNKADLGIAYPYDATHVACSAADIVLTSSGLRDIRDAVLTSRSIAGRMKNYTVFAVSVAVRNVISFTLMALVWKFDFPPFMVLIITIFEVVFIGWVAQDRVKPSHLPVTWNLTEILTSGIVLGGYLAMSTVLFFWAACETNIFPQLFGVSRFEKTTEDFRKLASAIYLQVSTSSYALIFVIRTLSWRPCNELVFALLQSQLLASLMAVYANWSFASIEGIGWGWAGVIWLYNLVVYVPLYFIKFFNQHTHRGFLKSTI